MITVKYEDSKRFSIESRGHKITIDQPLASDGTDKGMMPTELYVSSLAGCIGVYLVPFCKRHNITLDGLEIKAEYSMAENPHRIGKIKIDINLPALKLADEIIKKTILKIANTCTIHNTIENKPGIEIKFNEK